MDTLDYILTKYNLKGYHGRNPIELKIVREDFPQLFHELGLKVGAEIGVEQGLFSECLCKGNPGVHHFSIDPWQAYRGYRDHVNQEKLERFHESAKARLAQFNCTIIRKFSLDAVKDFKDGSLDYVYIDGNHDFQNVANDTAEWLRKVRVGGILAGHDFERHKGKSYIHVMECINGFTDAYRISPWFTTERRPHQARSFFWVKA